MNRVYEVDKSNLSSPFRISHKERCNLLVANKNGGEKIEMGSEQKNCMTEMHISSILISLERWPAMRSWNPLA